MLGWQTAKPAVPAAVRVPGMGLPVHPTAVSPDIFIPNEVVL